MTDTLRNKYGQRSIVTPRTAADPDIAAHGGKVVVCLEYGPAHGGPNQRPIPGDKHTPDDYPYMVDVTRDQGRIAIAALKGAEA